MSVEPGYSFLSYSRREYYFAESLAAALEFHKIPVWFDVRTLTPGEDWAAAIDRGLSGCASCILVASRAALASPYVQREWKAILAAGKPIIVVQFEAVTLPSELADATVLDFQGNFDRAVARLVAVLRSPSSSPVREMSLNNRLPRYRRDVWLTTFAAIIPGLLMLFSVLLALRDWIVIYPGGRIDTLLPWPVMLLFAVGYGGIGAALIRQGVRFLQRRQGYAGLRFPMPLSPLLAVFVYYLWTTGTELGLRRPPLVPSQIAVIGFGVLWLFNLYVFFFVSRRSADVLRWLPTDEAPASLTELTYFSPRTNSQSSSGAPVSREYRLFYSAPDANVAAELHNALARAGHREVDTAQPDVKILILSRWTEKSQIEAATAGTGMIIAVVASRIDAPDDMAQLMRYQWVDYRRRGGAQLEELAAFLRRPDPARWRNVLPETFRKPVLPARVGMFANVQRLSAAIGLVLVVIGFFVINTISGVNPSLIYVSDAVTVIGIIFSIWLAGTIADRELSFRRFLILEAINLTVSLVMQVVTGTSLFSIIVGTAIGLLIFRFGFFDALQEWLPTQLTSSAERPFAPKIGLLGHNAFQTTTSTLALCAVFLMPLILFTTRFKQVTAGEAVAGRLAFISKRDGNADVYFTEGNNGEVRRLTNSPENKLFASWSPDGTHLAYWSFAETTASLWVVDTSGSAPVRLTVPPLDNTPQLTWSSDGKYIAVATLDKDMREVILVDIAGKEKPRFLTNDGPGFFNQNPIWSPDGSLIAYIHGELQKGSMPKESLQLIKPDGSGVRKVVEDTGFNDPHWSPDGTRLSYQSGNKLVVFNISDSSKVVIDPVVIIHYAWSPDSKHLAILGEDDKYQYHVYLVDADGSNFHVIAPDADYSTPNPLAWSPDGTRIVYAWKSDLFTIAPGGGTPQPLTNDRADNVPLDWSASNTTK